MVVTMALFMISCESDEEDTTSPLAGTWELTNLMQSALYTAAQDIPSIGKSVGDTLGAGEMVWAEFSALGVEATAELFDDGTYTLAGFLPDPSDTLGFAPDTVSFNDSGDWTTADDLSTLLLDGAARDFPPSGEAGPIEVDDVDNPTTIDMTYSDVGQRVVVLPVDTDLDGVPDLMIPDVSINDYSSSTLGFTKQ